MSKKNKILDVSKTPTMTSLELVEYINADRKSKAEAEGLTFPCKKYRRLQHKHFLAKVPKVLGEINSAKFSAEYMDSTGRRLPSYEFPKREACLMAMSYSYESQAQVFDRMTALEGGKDINLMSFDDLAKLTVTEMQNRVAIAEDFSFREHGQKGSRLMTVRKKEKKLIKKAELLVKKLSQIQIPDLGGFLNGETI